MTRASPSRSALLALADTLPRVATGSTGDVFRHSEWAIKFAHPSPEARARLRAEASLHQALLAEGLPLPRLETVDRHGHFLTRAWVDGRAPQKDLTDREVTQLYALRLAIADVEHRLSVRVDFSPSNVLLTARGPVLLDGGARLAAPRFKAVTRAGFLREWRAWFNHPLPPRLMPPTLPPSGRFHVETPVGVDPGSRLLWLNEGLVRRWGVRWPPQLFQALSCWSTTAPPTTTKPSTRYTDGVGLDLRRGPRGDGRVVALGRIATQLGERELTAKGIGPTPLAWKGRAFHEDGRVSFPRTLWEVTVADELARLGFDVPEYLCVAQTGATTVDNTHRRWPAAVGVRGASTHWRLGHLRAVSHDPERLRALVHHVAPDALTRAGAVKWLDRFADTLGADIGQTDALQIHCFNATPGNVRLDGHLIDFSTVRFHRHHLPGFRFLEGAWTINRTRAVWSQQAMEFAHVLCAGGLLPVGEVAGFRRRALRRYLSGWYRGALVGFARAFGFEAGAIAPSLARRFVDATCAVRALRSEAEVRFEFFDQRCPAPRFDVLGKAPEVVRAIQRGHRAPWQVAQVDDVPLPREVLMLTRRWTRLLADLLKSAVRPARRWSELIRPWLEPEPLAALLHGRSKPNSFAAWKRLISSSRGLPEGRHRYAEARRLALARGHVQLPTFAGSTEVVVGLTLELKDELIRALRRTLGARLIGVVVHGSRLVERRELRRRMPAAFTRGDLRSKGADGVREFGPSRDASSDLDLKVFVRGVADEALERRVAKVLAALPAWFPVGSWPRQRLISTRHRTARAAFLAWNGAPRMKQLGKEPIPALQAAILYPGPERSR